MTFLKILQKTNFYEKIDRNIKKHHKLHNWGDFADIRGSILKNLKNAFFGIFSRQKIQPKNRLKKIREYCFLKLIN